MTFRIRKKFRFEAAHQLTSGYSKDCVDYIHGHSYIVEVFVESDTLDNDGMVIDFGLLKKVMKPLIDKWDHALILQDVANYGGNINCVKVSWNPTAENMAQYLYGVCNFELLKAHDSVNIYKVRVHETESGYAEYFENKA